MESLIREHQQLLEQHEAASGRPKPWGECTFDERHDYLQALGELYRQHGLAREAKVELQR
jgi:acyl-CoA reductase-like NAD-dependent aldehyde dehydrogenase